MAAAHDLRNGRLLAGRSPSVRDRLRGLLNPMRRHRRRQRLEREAMEEAAYLRRRHGALALAAAHEKLRRPDLTSWGRQVVQRAAELLERPA